MFIIALDTQFSKMRSIFEDERIADGEEFDYIINNQKIVASEILDDALLSSLGHEEGKEIKVKIRTIASKLSPEERFISKIPYVKKAKVLPKIKKTLDGNQKTVITGFQNAELTKDEHF